MKKDRQHERIGADLAVRFGNAADFVTEYAENLSVGGLFVRQAQGLVPLTEIDVSIELPGFQCFAVRARVAHVLDEIKAEELDRAPGAGLQLIKVPPGFDEALRRYLARLGARRDYLLLVEHEDALRLLQDAGYHAEKTDISCATEILLGANKVLAIVVEKAAAPTYREMLASAPKTVPIIGCDHSVDEELLLVELDRLIATK